MAWLLSVFRVVASSLGVVMTAASRLADGSSVAEGMMRTIRTNHTLVCVPNIFHGEARGVSSASHLLARQLDSGCGASDACCHGVLLAQTSTWQIPFHMHNTSCFGAFSRALRC